MVLISYNQSSLEKHKVTREQVQEAFTDPMRAIFDVASPFRQSFSELPETDSLRQIIIGHTYANVLLEIGIEMIDQNSLHIFHAQKISPRYYKKYKKWLEDA